MKILGALLLALTLSASAQLRETPVAAAPLGPAEGAQVTPLAATDGSDFFVVWGDSRGGTFGTRVTHDGRVLDTTGIFLADAYPTALLWCGGAYVLVYSAADNRSAGVVRFNSEGRIIDGPRKVTDSHEAVAATNGSTIVLAGADITVLDDRAERVEEIPMPVDGTYAWALASNGSAYELVVTAYTGLQNRVVAIPLAANGHPQSSQSLPSIVRAFVIASPAGYRVFFGKLSDDTVMTFDTANDPATASPLLGAVTVEGATTTTNGYLLATVGPTDHDLTIVHANGTTVLDPQPFSTTSGPGNATDPAFASAGDNVLLAWSEMSTDANVRAVILDSSGHPKSSPFDLAFSAPAQEAPAIATGAANDFVAWQEGSGIYGARVSPDGVPLDGRGIRLSALGILPQVVRDGDAYVVAWFGASVIDIRWIDASSGIPIGQTVAVDNPSASGYSVGRDDHGIVLFSSDRYGYLQAQRVGMAGPIGPAVPLTTASVATFGTTAVWNGHEWLVLWNEQRRIPASAGLPLFATTVKAERVLESLAVADSQPLTIVDFPSSAGSAVATTNGDEFFVVWSDNERGHLDGVFARTVSASGILGDPTLLVPATSETDVKSAVWDGSHYAVAYAARRDDAAYAFRLMLTHAGLGDQLVISAAAPNQYEVALAATPGRPLRAAYTRLATEPQYGYVFRLFTRDLVYARHRIAAH
jgi:hypothetical protein